MKFILVLLSALFSVSCFAEKVELKVKSEVMLEAVKNAGTMSFELPEFHVFNQSGIGIFYQKSLPVNFNELLEKALHEKVANGNALNSVLNELSTQNGEKYSLTDLSAYEFVFVEYWAEWCMPCLQQMKVVDAFISSHPNTKILWLKIERDPTKIEGISAEKH